jgi:hypothetical protein
MRYRAPASVSALIEDAATAAVLFICLLSFAGRVYGEDATDSAAVISDATAASVENQPINDQLPDSAQDTVNARDASGEDVSASMTDETGTDSSLIVSTDNAVSRQPADSTGKEMTAPHSVQDTLTDTTTVRNGFYLSAGFGWSLGSVKMMDLWQHSLPDSLGSLDLTTDAFAVPYDSTEPDLQNVDTAHIAFSVKEAPAPYSMCFPVSVSLKRLRENDFLSFSLQGSWMRKVFSATIATPDDSLERKVDIIESINHYTLFASFVYGVALPEHYFSVEGIERTSFTLALDLSPLLVTSINRKVTGPDDDERFAAIKKHIRQTHRFIHGTAAAGRLGLSTIRRVDQRHAMDYGIWFSLQWNGFFREEGKRVSFNAIAPSYHAKDRPLSWFSSRFELTIAILRRLKNSDETIQ